MAERKADVRRPGYPSANGKPVRHKMKDTNIILSTLPKVWGLRFVLSTKMSNYPKQNLAFKKFVVRPLWRNCYDPQYYNTNTRGVATGGYIGIYTPPPKSVYLNFLCGCFVSLTQDKFDIVQFIPTQIKFLATPLVTIPHIQLFNFAFLCLLCV